MGKGDHESDKSKDLMAALEKGVRAVLRSREAKPSDKVAAINAGVKLVAIQHKILEPDKGFFDT